MSGKVDYFVSQQAAPTEEACIFVCLDARMAPAIVGSLLRYTSPAFWLSAEDWHRGYQKAAAQLEGLMSDCGETIVNNIIALRGIDPAAPRDPVYGTPVAAPQGSTLLDLFSTLQGPAGTPGVALGRITAATEATATATQQGLLVEEGGETVARIAQLALLL